MKIKDKMDKPAEFIAQPNEPRKNAEIEISAHVHPENWVADNVNENVNGLTEPELAEKIAGVDELDGNLEDNSLQPRRILSIDIFKRYARFRC